MMDRDHNETITGGSLRNKLEAFVSKEDCQPYEDLVVSLYKSKIQEEELILLLNEVSENISFLDKKFHHFVKALLQIQWMSMSKEAKEVYSGFLVDLVSAQSCYVRLVMERLVSIFKREHERDAWVDGIPSKDEEILFQNVHNILRLIIKIVPMASEMLLQSVKDTFPFWKVSAPRQEEYVYNILRILEYQPLHRHHILVLLINKLIVLDLNCPKNEIEEAEEEEMDEDVYDEIIENSSSRSMKHPIANTLDILLCQLFRYIRLECYDESSAGNELNLCRTKHIYDIVLSIYDEIILPTLNTCHVQFIMFYLCSFKVSLAENFICFLWHKFSSPNVVPVVRQAAVFHLSSFISRASYVSVSLMKSVLSNMASWIHNYITRQDQPEYCKSSNIHGVFYTVCQSMFYVIAFRHRELVNCKKNLLFLQGLNLTKIVTCRLNPLRFCLPAVMQSFAAVTRNYQLAYCYSIIEHNARFSIPIVYGNSSSTMESPHIQEAFFPFDPYILLRSSSVITPIFRDYSGSISETEVSPTKDDYEEGEEEDDDFLGEHPSECDISIANSCTDERFTYGSSPGFITNS